ncbi:hypothetical protein [Kitasatospora sp. NPDC085464]|uniref:hypothetical protein n=1 Tax=Kitasatospora sp. NPDC085464 TaxID=3364063 RepID=UPI0037C8903F
MSSRKAAAVPSSRITIRQLLDHTSGIHNFARTKLAADDFVGVPFLQHRFDSFTPRQLVEIALAYEPTFAPERAGSTPTPTTCSPE